MIGLRRARGISRNVDTVAGMAGSIDALPAATRSAVIRRITDIVSAFGYPVPVTTMELLGVFDEVLRNGGANRMWLALAVLTGRLPTPAEIQRSVRLARLNGPMAALATSGFAATIAANPTRHVSILVGAVVVDVHHASRTPLSTGIQRVTRQAASRWQREHEVVFVNWDTVTMSLTQLSDDEVSRTLSGSVIPAAPDLARPVVVPWRCTYLLPELHSDVERADHLHALLESSGNRSGVIGFDCVPISTAETVIEGMSNGFAAGLAAIAHADRLCAISESAAQEFRGWRAMLAGTGLSGPDISAVPLPVEAAIPDDVALERARNDFILGGLPMILVVGSHEPRKNHLAVLHAAELLWREGLAFTLAFIGGSAWHDTTFRDRLRSLQAINRPVHSVSAVDDSALWAAYKLARFTVFPSLNEGFGLPVAESLALGTPVITSRFGSMAEIAEAGGALLVDPRDDHDLRDGMRTLLRDDTLLARLRSQAVERPRRTWDDYARELWNVLVPPEPEPGPDWSNVPTR